MDKVLIGLFVVIGALALGLSVGLLLAYPLMLMINYLFTPAVLTTVFGASQISFWKAYFLSVLLSWTVKTNASSK